MIAVKSNIASKLLDKQSSLETLLVSVSYDNKDITIKFCVMYIPPDTDRSQHEVLLECLSNLSCHCHLLILGDVNLPDVDWENYQGHTEFSSNFCNKIFELNLEQTVNKPTHISGHILDVVLANFSISQPIVLECHPQGLSLDHYIINFSIPAPLHTVEQKASYTAYNYSKTDWECMYSFLMNYNFHDYYCLSNVEAAWETLKNTLHMATQTFVPQFLVRKKEYPKWFTPTIKHHLNCIHSLRRKFKKKPTDNLKQKHQSEEDRLQALMEEAKSDYESKLINNFGSSNNSNLIYKYISALSSSSSLPQQMYLHTNTAISDRDKAKLFNNYFYSVFNDRLSPIQFNVSSSISNDTLLNDVVITTADVHQALCSLDPNKTIGPDGVSPKVLKYCADVPCQLIRYLFQLTITNGHLPTEWHTHCVVPIFKSGDRAAISKYHPISLLCIISKVLEKIIFNVLIKFLSDSFSPCQFGFLPGRSTLQQLLLFINELLEAKTAGKTSHVIYLYLRRAFDSVCHDKLLHKLRSFGITGVLLKWIEAYLSRRSQYVRVNISFSDMLLVLSGVPQGSILGPLFFVLFINDLSLCLQFSLAFIYADDTKCLRHRKNSSEMNCLQKDIDNLFHWSQRSDLFFNFNKFVHLQFWSKKNATITYSIDNKTIVTTDSTKDLGITITQSLTWDSHYKVISSKAYKIPGLMHHSFSSSGPVLSRRKLRIYLTCSVTSFILLTNMETRHINMLERIQRQATRWILNDYQSSYGCRLMSLHLLPLMYIYELNDIIFFIKSH